MDGDKYIFDLQSEFNVKSQPINTLSKSGKILLPPSLTKKRSIKKKSLVEDKILTLSSVNEIKDIKIHKRIILIPLIPSI